MKIEVRDNIKGTVNTMSEYPRDRICRGVMPDENELKIFIKNETLTMIDSYLRSDKNNELGGVLVGDVCTSETEEIFITIDNLIIARHTNSSLSRLTFTHDTWISINEILEKDFPGKKILGWFHSHPGHTVFLSNYDVFIQENFFNMEYMVAYVYDPTIDDRGFFYWRDKKIVKSNGYFVYDNSGQVSEYKAPEGSNKIDLSEENIIPKTNEAGSGFKSNLILVILLINILLLIVMIYNYVDLRKNALLKEDLTKELTVVKEENERLKIKVDNFIVNYELQSAGLQKNLQGEVTGKKEQVPMNKSKGSEEEQSEKVPGNSETIKYTVKPGDSLDKIAREFFKGKEGIEIVMKQNNLKSKNDIRIGQILEIPLISE